MKYLSEDEKLMTESLETLVYAKAFVRRFDEMDEGEIETSEILSKMIEKLEARLGQ